MIRKPALRILLSVLFIWTLLLSCSASAQESIYVPGEITSSLFTEAFQSGKIIKTDVRFAIDADTEAMGMTGESAAQTAAIIKALNNTTLTFGAGNTSNGFRLELAAQYDAAVPVAADAALNITYDGLQLETSLLSGECISINWETLLALCNLSSEEIQMVLSLRDLDPQALAVQLIETVGPYLEMAGQVLAPYGETVTDFLATLPSQVSADLPDDGYYPAAAQEVMITMTAADLGKLITLLADQLENDFLISMAISAVLSQQTELPISSTSELCAIIREAAAGLTDTSHPVSFYIGIDETGEPLYLSVNSNLDSSSAFAFDAVHRSGDQANSGTIMLDICTIKTDTEIPLVLDGFTSSFRYAFDPANKNIYSYSGQLQMSESSEAFLSLSFDIGSEASVSDDGLSAYTGSQVFALSMLDGSDPVSVILTSGSYSSLTPDNGECSMITGSIDSYAGGTSVPVTFTNEFILSPGASGPVAVYTESSSMPEHGIAACNETFTLYTEAYDPAETAALMLTRIETVSSADMQALIQRLSESAQTLIHDLTAALPPEAVQFIEASF